MDFKTHILVLPRNLFFNRAKTQLAPELLSPCQKESPHIFPASWGVIWICCKVPTKSLIPPHMARGSPPSPHPGRSQWQVHHSLLVDKIESLLFLVWFWFFYMVYVLLFWSSFVKGLFKHFILFIQMLECFGAKCDEKYANCIFYQTLNEIIIVNKDVFVVHRGVR